MILHPSIIALLLSSALIAFLALYASWYGVIIIRKWDIRSGGSLQLELERRTYLISTILGYVFVFQLFSLFLYVFTADSLCTLFTGAMCAAGTLNVNGYGYPVLVLKVLNFLFAGFWLVLNYADTRAEDYPLIRKKYVFLVAMMPFLIGEAVFQVLYFRGLAPDVITSCCGSLFSETRGSVTSDVAALPVIPTAVAWYLVMVATIISGIVFYRQGRGGYLFSLFSFVMFIVTIASLLSFISLYVYELPTHHCPFCMLQKEYGYVGYLYYGTLFGSTVSGMGVGILMPFRGVKSLDKILPEIQKKLALLSVILIIILGAFVTYRVLAANVKLVE